MHHPIIQITQGVARNPQVHLAMSVTAEFCNGEHIAVVGPNGSGKGLFVDTLLGKYPLREGILQYNFSPSATHTVHENVKYIAFRDSYGAADTNYYYQQRWNASDQEEISDVRELLSKIDNEQLKNELFELFQIKPLLDKKIIFLSSGEQRLALLARAFVKDPELLILDEPLHGLDT